MVQLNGKKLCECCFSEINSDTCPVCGYNKKTYINDPSVLSCGSVLAGKYVIGKVIGKGGFGITYLAYDNIRDCKVAIKEYYPNGLASRTVGRTTLVVSNDADAKSFQLGAEKFYNEAKLVAQFNGNPSIVSVYEFFYENDTVYFSMEYLNGKSLKDYLNDKGSISEEQAIYIANCISGALLVAHSANVMHRDISPDNIMLCDDGTVKLIDFGAARQVTAESSQNLSVILKAGFAPLEQYQKKGKQGPWTDIYALGATLYYALTLDTIDDPMTRMDDDSEFQQNSHKLSENIWNIIRTATMLKIEDRYQDVFVFREALLNSGIQAAPIVIPTADNADNMPEFRTAQPFSQTITESEPAKKSKPQKKTGIIIGAVAAGIALIAGAIILICVLLSPTATFKGKEDPEDLIKAVNIYLASDEYKFVDEGWEYDYQAFDYVGKLGEYYQFYVKGKYINTTTGVETEVKTSDNHVLVVSEDEEGIRIVPRSKWKLSVTVNDNFYNRTNVHVEIYEWLYNYETGVFSCTTRIYNGRDNDVTLDKLDIEFTDKENNEIVAEATFSLTDKLLSKHYIDKTFNFTNGATYKFVDDVSNDITWKTNISWNNN